MPRPVLVQCWPVPGPSPGPTVSLALRTRLLTPQMHTEAGGGRVVRPRSAGQEVTKPGLAPAWLALKATLSPALGFLLQPGWEQEGQVPWDGSRGQA